ncbi:hypothetical protein PR202_gb12830 [Eleusine coracana subsp. coracana]|uniref:Alpha/beta hydrolase fold-3 domain-containing protein n=1 Tax=Eleusine coracana subsp. coracana TaxID=191504 RepID=A0AAV5ER60_ELECO|nr:hypothetical protein PR202_gb12830 [Eleusine coracana subsp. coracana]
MTAHAEASGNVRHEGKRRAATRGEEASGGARRRGERRRGEGMGTPARGVEADDGEGGARCGSGRAGAGGRRPLAIHHPLQDGRRHGVISKDVVFDGGRLATRVFIPAGVHGTRARLPLLVYIHGGVFVVQSAFSPSHTALLNSLVSLARVIAVSVEYRLAPEHPVPAAYDDAAGGNIAHQVTLRVGNGGGLLPGGAWIQGMVLLHPYFSGEEPVPSEGTDSGRLVVARRVWGLVCGGRYGLDHPFINPLAMPADSWAALGCRRAMVTVAELDEARDRGRWYLEALRRSAWAGEEALLYETRGEGHAYFLQKAGGLDRGEKELAAVASFIASSTICTTLQFDF